MKRFVLDASALIIYVESRPGAETVQRLIKKAAEEQAYLLVSVVNWGEAYQVFWRNHGRVAADATLLRMGQLQISLIDADRNQALLAASFRMRFGLPFADGFAAALAYREKARLVTSDKDFERVKSEIRLLRLP